MVITLFEPFLSYNDSLHSLSLHIIARCWKLNLSQPQTVGLQHLVKSKLKSMQIYRLVQCAYFEKFKVNNNNYACTELAMFTVVLVPGLVAWSTTAPCISTAGCKCWELKSFGMKLAE